jgi:hypothetical protein
VDRREFIKGETVKGKKDQTPVKVDKTVKEVKVKTLQEIQDHLNKDDFYQKFPPKGWRWFPGML